MEFIPWKSQMSNIAFPGSNKSDESNQVLKELGSFVWVKQIIRAGMTKINHGF